MPNKKGKANAVGGQVKGGGKGAGGDPILDLEALIANGGGTTSFGGTSISVTPLTEPVVNGMKRPSLPSPLADAAAPPTTKTTPAGHTCTHECVPTSESAAAAARAKAMFMSTLVPGSEAFSSHKIADPRDTVGGNMWAPWAPAGGVPGVSSSSSVGGLSLGGVAGGHLQNKTNADKDKGKGRATVASSSSYNPGHNIHHDGFDDLRRDFLGDWIDGKPLDKYIEAAKLKPTLTKPPPQLDGDSTTTQAVTITKSGTSSVCTKSQQSSQQLQIQTRQPQTGSSSKGVKQQQRQEKEEVGSTAPKQWKRSFVNHDNFLSEFQVMAFAGGDVQVQNQVQAALTKVLMRKLPTLDLQILWAIMYGGDDAPWPGSLSPIIPGVTTTATVTTASMDTHLSQADEG